MFLENIPVELAEFGALTNVEITPSGNLNARPFSPRWLVDNIIPPDGIDTRPEERRKNEEIASEPYLRLLGYGSWQSQAQKEATWMMLNARPGSTSLVALPTGSGKSLCFQAVSRFSSGVTIVVVPTVALAIDQWRSACEVLEKIPDIKPLYFAAGDADLDPDQVVNDLAEGRSRLIFTSPEALVSGRLRPLVEKLVEKRLLDNLVIDEAHVIETWGIYFRVDFQLLSSLIKKWRLASENRLKIFLLSATFTSNTRKVLQNLFYDSGEWNEFISQRLRPEVNYYRQLFETAESRRQALMECVWNLPRPAIIYTTEVKESTELFAYLQKIGFSRIGCFNGDTSAGDRRRLLSEWRNHGIDLMIATSAFGLGVDKADVRTVVHSCFPENVHRYYQEVGRGGRDGNSSLAVLLATKKDIKVAEGLAPKLLSNEIAQKRWEAMWVGKLDVPDTGYTYFLDPSTKRLGLLGTRTYKENVRWNKRLLLQLLRAEKLELLDIHNCENEDGTWSELVKVKLKFSGDSPTVAQEIAPIRAAELEIADEGIQQMLDYLNGEKPICRLLKRLYGPNVQIACGGCPSCRKRGFPYRDCANLTFETLRPMPGRHTLISSLPDFANPSNLVSWRKIIRDLVKQKGIRRIITNAGNIDKILEIARDCFFEDGIELYRVDKIIDKNQMLFRNECVAVIHIGSLDWSALKLESGNDVSHFIAKGISIIDQSGRRIGEADGWLFYPDFDLWSANTTKCLQTNQ